MRSKTKLNHRFQEIHGFLRLRKNFGTRYTITKIYFFLVSKLQEPSFISSNKLSFLELTIHCCEADVKFLENLTNPIFESKRCVFCGEGQRFRGNCRKDVSCFGTCYFCHTEFRSSHWDVSFSES